MRALITLFTARNLRRPIGYVLAPLVLAAAVAASTGVDVLVTVTGHLISVAVTR